jgi:hypothetical protein
LTKQYEAYNFFLKKQVYLIFLLEFEALKLEEEKYINHPTNHSEFEIINYSGALWACGTLDCCLISAWAAGFTGVNSI